MSCYLAVINVAGVIERLFFIYVPVIVQVCFDSLSWVMSGIPLVATVCNSNWSTTQTT